MSREQRTSRALITPERRTIIPVRRDVSSMPIVVRVHELTPVKDNLSVAARAKPHFIVQFKKKGSSALQKAREAFKSTRGPAYATGLLALIFLSLLGVYHHSQNFTYSLSPAAAKLVGSSNPTNLKALSYDAKAKVHALAGKPPEAGTLRFGTSSYSASLHDDPSRGISLTDPSSQVSLGFAPSFRVGTGKMINGRKLYPLPNYQHAQLVYTLKQNGIEENLVLNKKGKSDTASFGYKLNLPSGLEARMLSTGSIGIYGGDPTLLGNISYANASDQAKVEQARKNSAKTTLMYGIPAPIVRGGGGQVKASFKLVGNIITVHVQGLKQASYPLTIDPSVVVTSASDFGSGSGDNIDFDTANNQILRGALTGGNVPSWTASSSTNYANARFGAAVVTYNGFIYVIGGCKDTTNYPLGSCTAANTLSDVSYASVSSGSVGNYSTTTPLTFGRYWHSAVAYNGYLYVMDGTASGNTNGNSTVQYIKINPNGTLGTSWITAPSTNLAAYWRGVAAYKGHLYLVGGRDTSSHNNVEQATVKPDGSLSAWTPTTSLLTARGGLGLAVWNGYLYATGGNNNGGVILSTAEMAKIQDDGTVSSWTTITPLTGTRFLQMSYAAGGYLYIAGGCLSTATGFDCSSLGSDVQYAPLYQDGTVGKWQQAAGLGSGRMFSGMAASGGYLYFAGGCTNTSCSALANDTYYGMQDAAGSLGSTNASGAGATHSAILPISGAGIAAAVDNGFLYIAGGQTSASAYNNHIYHTKLNIDGTFSWPSVGSGGSCTQAFTYWCDDGVYTGAAIFEGYAGSSMVIYDHCMLLIGGVNSSGTTNNIYMAPLAFGASVSNNPTNDGQVGAVVQATNKPTARAYATANIKDGTLILAGGVNGATYSSSLQGTNFTNNGCGVNTLATWFNAGALTIPRAYHSSYVANGHVYYIGGYNASGNNILSSADDLLLGTSVTVINNAVDSKIAGGGYVEANGEFYVVGGTTDNSSGALTSITRRLSIGAGTAPASAKWTDQATPASPLPTAGLNRNAVVSANGFLYNIGGCTAGATNAACTSFSNTIYYSSINNGGSGAATATESAVTSGTRSAQTTYADNGYFYKLGGCTTVNQCDVGGNPADMVTTVSRVKLNSDGTLADCGGSNSWCDSTGVNDGALPECRNHGMVKALGNYLYYFGGEADCSSAAFTTSVIYAAIDPVTGALSKPNASCVLRNPSTSTVWCETAALSAADINDNYNNFESTVYGNNIYINHPHSYMTYIAQDSTTGELITPSGCPNVQSGTLYCQTPDPTGTLGYFDGPLLAYNGRMYIIGGYSGYYNTGSVSAPINNDGSTGTWRSETRMPFTRNSSQAAIVDGFVYSFYGYDANDTMVSCYSGILRAPIRADGTIGKWESQYFLTSQGRSGGSTMVVNHRIYSFDGACGNPAIVQPPTIISPKAMARSGTYSRSIDLGNDSTLTRQLINFTTTLLSGNLKATYKTEAADGTIDTATTYTASSGIFGALNNVMARYFQVTFTLDDSQTATFPDTTPMTITDFELRFHAATGQRLHGGKTFTENKLRALDTEGP